MSTAYTSFIAARVLTDVGGPAPGRIQLFPMGEFSARDGRPGTLKGVKEGETHTDRAIVTGTPLVECAPSNGDPFNDKTDGGEDTDPEYSTGDVTEIDGKQLCADTQTTSNTDDWNGYRAKPLASTGTAVLGLAGGALAVLLAGGSLLVFRKRHRAQGSGRHTSVNAGK